MQKLQCGRFMLDLQRPLLMGIVNITPDSFSDGGHYCQINAALAHAEKLLADGADILDIGGESTRPGAAFVPADEETSRVIPVIKALQSFNVPISIDTRKAVVMRAALDAGVDLVNDISALEDKGALELVAQSNAAICLMHMQGDPHNMQATPNYLDVVVQVSAYLAARRDAALAAGISHHRLLLDPGFGFGKTLEHNIALFKALPDLLGQLATPLLIGVSRKSMLGQITGQAVADRMPASIAAALMAAQAGSAVIRVHDVRETVDALKIWHALQ
ncbi:dihydropteroate synthase [Janthinobacterium sp. B9-8]|uniref:dihydropteroate synthase n=1 Tax=Janthinobacterium sp. B9-8 TaxID=1236179 RepID=UPI00061D2350|nr:dihydropteroate synthase [Janthinobacterium sp. B9-8]AMC35487.1 dihydropteroate synthase [Janthinobacterium sp. B9-8]